ncbi:protein-methionine-sulfoxide reductase heme-binding subunit MsrQ [Parasphingorhabdus cellanae]|uniref:Ferric reductase-like transmembrane domain-containing protein n=1 Tax=Parasphingorhabdus cellanae TaxID=2806553 RepID=A0ABX7T8Z8_9SPHN|nr:ferric reductase-like transmembrane domain-containing protein [Parasphingorhabdus cellanae]QTD57410.1 ferric reductase-like transmembrane domain-containing protein [Parasphingorhabdus cellanae]
MEAMTALLRILNSLPIFWLLLSLPAVALMRGYWVGDIIAMDMLHPTGEFSARFMIVAMIISPLITIFGNRGWTSWLLRRRRSLGVAAFGYAMLHLVFYIIDMEELEPILAEFWAPGIWTGWAAMLLFVPLAITSNDASMRWLKRRWKMLQRLVYGAALLTLAHWLLIHDGMTGALVHFIPLFMLQLLRMIIIYGRKNKNVVKADSPPASVTTE